MYIRDLFCHLLLFAIVVDVVTENAREGFIKEVLYPDDLLLISVTMEGMKERFLKWKNALKSKGLKVNLEKTKVMVCLSEGEVIQSRIDPCAICGKKMTINSVLCTKMQPMDSWKLFKLKEVPPSAAKFFAGSKCDKATDGAEEVQQEVMCDEVETVRRFCYLGDRLNASVGCETAVTARTRVGWKKFRLWRDTL